MGKIETSLKEQIKSDKMRGRRKGFHILEVKGTAAGFIGRKLKRDKLDQEGEILTKKTGILDRM